MTKNLKTTASVAAVLAVGDYTVAVANLPEGVQHTLMQRTFAHIINNEAAAVRTRLQAERNADDSAKYNDGELADLIHAWRTDKIAAMINGEFSLRVVGPRMTPDEKILREIAKNNIIAALTAQKKPMPKASDSDAWDAAIDSYLGNAKLRGVADQELARRKASVMPDVTLPDDIFAVKSA